MIELFQPVYCSFVYSFFSLHIVIRRRTVLIRMRILHVANESRERERHTGNSQFFYLSHCIIVFPVFLLLPVYFRCFPTDSVCLTVIIVCYLFCFKAYLNICRSSSSLPRCLCLSLSISRPQKLDIVKQKLDNCYSN